MPNDLKAQVEDFKKNCRDHCLPGEECLARKMMLRLKRKLDGGQTVTWHLLYFNCGQKRELEKYKWTTIFFYKGGKFYGDTQSVN